MTQGIRVRRRGPMALLKRFAHLFIGQRRGGETTEQEENCFVCLFLTKNDLIVLMSASPTVSLLSYKPV